MIKIFTYAFNNPVYLEYQYKLIKKFSVEPFEFTCIDNSVNPQIREGLRQTCIRNGIRHAINEKPDHSLPGTSHYSALQWSFNTFMESSEGFALMLDHDAFPIKPFSISDILGDNLIGGLAQSKEHVQYLHPCCVLLNLGSLPNKSSIDFNGNKVDDIYVDIGGQLAMYFRNNPEVKVKFLSYGLVTKDDVGVIPTDLLSQYTYPTNPFEFIGGTFLHTRLGSNWNYINKFEFEKRDKLIYTILDRYLI